jgi:tRNA dimethylallyltransferase
LSVLILTGPTASGKTALAIDLARRFDAEIVSADSRQIYRGMPVGTAAPTPEERAAVPHHLLDFLDPNERYSAAQFCADALGAIESIHRRRKRAIVVGGTGFYIRALTGSVTLAPRGDEALRARLAREAVIHDSRFLHDWLSLRDPRRAAGVEVRDTYRVVRALEVALATPAIGTRAIPTLASRGIPFLKVFLDVGSLSVLLERIERRTDAMLANGLLEEAERIGVGAVASSAVGYPQALAYLEGLSTFDEMRSALIRATRRYAKRQQMWFRNEPHGVWLAPVDVERMAREKLGWV